MTEQVFRLENVFVSNCGAIFDDTGNFIEEACPIFNKWRKIGREKEYTRAKYLVDRAINRGDFVTLPDNKPYVHAFPFHHIYAFGHIWDVMRQFRLLDKEDFDSNLLCGADTHHTNNIRKHFAIMGFDEKSMVHFGQTELPLFVKRLTVPVDDTWVARVEPVDVAFLRDRYFNYNSSLNSTALGSDRRPVKLYLSRYKAKDRYVSNEDQVWEALNHRGFIRLTGKETLEKHIELFSNAIICIGPHGSLFRNSLFQTKNPVMIEYCPINRPDVSIKHMSEKAGVSDYRQINLEGDENHNIEIDVDEMIKIIDEVLESKLPQ